MNIFAAIQFDKELFDILTPRELVYVALIASNPDVIEACRFCESASYEKLFDFYINEMPYGVAKARDGEPDVWIIDRLIERAEGRSV
jgi:hypothetical protein